jgi:hypothetical protein
MKYRALLLAPIFACVFAAPASSQAVVDNPGMCAFYPDANCENYGPGNPYTGEYSNRDLPAANAFMAAPAGHPSLKKSRPTR